MNALKTLIFIVISSFFAVNAFAQVSFSSQKLLLAKQRFYAIQLSEEATAASIILSPEQSFSNTYIVAETDTFLLAKDVDFSEVNRSQLLIFGEPIKKLALFSGNLEGNITLITQFVKPLSINHLSLRQKADSCDKPAIIAASEWRKGLTPPKEAPAKTTVKHVIVHHSAGSNTTTNFLEAVRNIYTFHTTPPPNGNGWNDVGYNFLITQDGTIFQGRDGQDIMEGDNVLGAHFCGKNGGTMGICLLGNYNEVQPSNASIKSLINLAGWKLGKEKLPVIGQFQHTNGLLNIVSGHRDGCATECPGNNLYAKLSELRQKIALVCTYTNAFITAIEAPQKQFFKIYPQPSSEFLMVDVLNDFSEKNSPQIFDLQGKIIPCDFVRTTENQWKVNIKHLSEGTYFLRLGNDQKGAKFVKL
jgi:N-acetylmuramoyl-L-alanine amidase/Secretion system C-terminal sorting domain